MLSGYKTYITAIVAIITAIAAYLVGDASMIETAQMIFTALIGAFVRAGMTTESTPRLF